MAYSFFTFAQAVTALANRLQDPNQTYWSQPNELLNAVIESVRFFQSLTGSHKQKFTFPTVADAVYYDLPNLPGSPVNYNATDVEVANNVLAALIEPPLPLVGSWVGTGQFTFAQLQSALQNRLNRFLGDTGCVVQQQIINGPPPPGEYAPLPEGTLDVRRCAWISLPHTLTWVQIQEQWGQANFPWDQVFNSVYPLGRLDEWAEQAYAPGAAQNPDLPLSYSVFAVAPQTLRLVPPPLNEGVIDLISVPAGPTVNLNPASPVVLNVPDDLSPALKWGVLADLLGSDGPSRDYARAQYAEQRYQEFVSIGQSALPSSPVYPSVLASDVNNITVGLGSVFDLDSYVPDWQNTLNRQQPTFVGMAGRNLACLGPLPDAVYGVGLWMVVNAPTTGFIQVNRGSLDAILDYAQHIASFKMGGAEFDGTERLYQNLISSAKNENGRLSAVAFYRGQLQQPAAKSEMEVARMLV
jgi:hypothetical protein